MKIAVSSYSFSQAMRDGRMTIMDVIPKAKEMGYEGVEIVRGGWSDGEMRTMAPKLKAQSESTACRSLPTWWARTSFATVWMPRSSA